MEIEKYFLGEPHSHRHGLKNTDGIGPKKAHVGLSAAGLFFVKRYDLTKSSYFLRTPIFWGGKQKFPWEPTRRSRVVGPS